MEIYYCPNCERVEVGKWSSDNEGNHNSGNCRGLCNWPPRVVDTDTITRLTAENEQLKRQAGVDGRMIDSLTAENERLIAERDEAREVLREMRADVDALTLPDAPEDDPAQYVARLMRNYCNQFARALIADSKGEDDE